MMQCSRYAMYIQNVLLECLYNTEGLFMIAVNRILCYILVLMNINRLFDQALN